MVIGPRPQPEKKIEKTNSYEKGGTLLFHPIFLLLYSTNWYFGHCSSTIGRPHARHGTHTHGTAGSPLSGCPRGLGSPAILFFCTSGSCFFGNVGLIWSDSKLLMIEVISETWSFRFSWCRGEFTSLRMISGCGLARPSLTGYLTKQGTHGCLHSHDLKAIDPRLPEIWC